MHTTAYVSIVAYLLGSIASA